MAHLHSFLKKKMHLIGIFDVKITHEQKKKVGALSKLKVK